MPAFSFIHYLLSTQVRLFFILKICFNSITGLGIDERMQLEDNTFRNLSCYTCTLSFLKKNF